VAERRTVLNQARDTLAWQEQITAEEAFARLARRSSTEARSIFDIARDVADGTASDTEATG
jgi:AmiR/NasT family two-component response regulator